MEYVDLLAEIARMQKTMESLGEMVSDIIEEAYQAPAGTQPATEESSEKLSTLGGTSLDPTKPNQAILQTRAEAYYGLVQQRRRSGDFAREYEQYRGDHSVQSPVSPGVPEWVHDSEDPDNPFYATDGGEYVDQGFGGDVRGEPESDYEPA